MDADQQHPWNRVKDIIDGLKEGAKLVIASRKKVEGFWPIPRKAISYLGNFLGKFSLLTRGKGCADYDVLTGFFGAETRFWKEIVFENNRFASFRLKGYKILFDFLKVMPDNTSLKNIPYIFGARKTGTSKLNMKVYLEYLKAVFS